MDTNTNETNEVVEEKAVVEIKDEEDDFELGPACGLTPEECESCQ